MKNVNNKIIILIFLATIICIGTGCYDKFDEYVMGQMGINGTTSEIVSSEKKKETNNTVNNKQNKESNKEPYLHEPTDKFNTVRFANESNDGIKPSEWIHYETGCWWEIETNIDGQEICRTMYNKDGKAVECIKSTWGRGKYKGSGEYYQEVLKYLHYDGPYGKLLGGWETDYNAYNDIDYYNVYDLDGKTIYKWIYETVTPPAKNGWVTPYQVLQKITVTKYDVKGNIVSTEEIKGSQMDEMTEKVEKNRIRQH